MPRVSLVESHWKENWYVDLFSDGSLEVFSSYQSKKNKLYNIYPHTDMVSSSLPKYVKEMVFEMRDCHRDLLRLPRIYRVASHFCKTKVKVSYDRYLWCERAGLWCRPWSLKVRRGK